MRSISILKCGISFVLGFPTRSAGVGTLIYACTLDSYREVSCHNNYDAFIIEYIQLREIVAGYSS